MKAATRVIFAGVLYSTLAVASVPKAVKTLTLSDGDIGTVHTALGFTTMIQLDSRPSAVVLGDADAFKVEYVGNGLAIKPMLPRAVTNLFVVADSDRFNFELRSGPASDADFVVKVRNANPTGYPVNVVTASSIQDTGPAPDPAEQLIRKSINKSTQCQGLRLTVSEVAYPKSQSVYLVAFGAKLTRPPKDGTALPFEAGDIVIEQGERSLPIENVYVERLQFISPTYQVRGTLVVRQSDLQHGVPLRLGFNPDFHHSKNGCPWVTFSREAPRRAPHG